MQAGPYTITPLPATHMSPEHEPFVYHIEDADGTSIFYLHDSGYYAPAVWDYFKAQKKSADLISFDTTCGEEDTHLRGHAWVFPTSFACAMNARNRPCRRAHALRLTTSRTTGICCTRAGGAGRPAQLEVSFGGKTLLL